MPGFLRKNQCACATATVRDDKHIQHVTKYDNNDNSDNDQRTV